jgi:Secretion system C-terminal sorting domain
MKQKTTLVAAGVLFAAHLLAQSSAPAGSFIVPALAPVHQTARFYTTPVELFISTAAQQSAQNAQPAMPLSATETIIGTSTYPLQTNNSVHRQIIANSDGTVSAMWTYSSGSFFSWPERGTGYNYFNGTAWGAQPTLRTENVRTGFGNIIVIGDGRELTVAHNTGNNTQHFMQRPVKGTGAWTDNPSLITYPGGHPGSLWPVTAVGGPNNDVIHHIALSTPQAFAGGNLWHGQDGAIQYSRSNNGGATFAVQNVLIPAFDSTQEIGYNADAYSIDARDNYVAVVAGGFGRDLVLAKSSDGGVTWVKTVIQDFPIPLFDDQITDVTNDGLADTLATNDGSISVLIDNSNMVHVWFGSMSILNDDSTDGQISFFPGTNGLEYWNEGLGAGNSVVITGALDLDNNGTLDIPVDFGTYQKSLASFPSTAINSSGVIFLAYSAIVENSADLVTSFSVRNIYLMASTDNGATWTTPLNVSPDSTLEKVYPCLARDVVAGQLNLVYERDEVAGHGVSTAANPPDPDNANSIHEIIHLRIPASDVFVGIEEPVLVSDLLTYPNPSSGEIWLAGSNLSGNILIELYTAAGQLVSHRQINNNQTSSPVALGTEGLAPGCYFVRVQTTEGNQVQRIIIE